MLAPPSVCRRRLAERWLPWPVAFLTRAPTVPNAVIGPCQGLGGSGYLWSTERHQGVPRLHQLSEAYAERTLINDTICLHRGADPAGVAPDGAGVITSPLDGLRWCA